MNRLESMFSRADFSKETDFKSVLRARLFGEIANSHASSLQRLSFDAMEMVNAAGDIDTMNGVDDK